MEIPQLIQKIAQAENTPELRSYWTRRFNSLFEKEVFSLHPKTEELLQEGATISKPFTPFGVIHIDAFIDGETIDEVELQNTIDNAIRLLDNILDALTGDEKSLSIMNDFRKIALGIDSYESYINQAKEKTVRIDTIGNLVSNGAYRASESIAEEKGTCKSWDSIKFLLRSKTFEYWYHTDTGKIIDAHSLSAEFSQDTVIRSGYEIIPRRNSHLLSYPNESDWNIWADREFSATQSSPTEINTISENTKTSEKKESEEPSSVSNKEAEVSEDNTKQSDTETITELTQREETTIQEQPEKPILNLDTPETQLSEVDTNTELDTVPTKTKELAVTLDEQNTIQLSDKQPQFQIGELVIITDKNSPFYHLTSQIVDHEEVSDTDLYTLKSNKDEISTIKWREGQLQSVDLIELLDRVNIIDSSTPSQESTIVLQSLILDETGKNILVSNISGKKSLPEVILPTNAIPEQILADQILKKFGIASRITDEIGSAVEFSTSSSPYKVILAYASKLTNDTIPDSVEWMAFRDAQFSLSSSTRVICNKYNRMKQQTNQTNHQTQANTQAMNNTTTNQSQPTSNAPQQHVSQQVQSSPVTTSSQYVFKLENLVQSQVFGDVLLGFQFKDNKPILTSINAANLSPEQTYFAEVVMHFANHLISSGKSTEDVAKLFKTTPHKNNQVALNDLLLIIADSLKNVPAKPDQLSKTVFN
jgi:hypothetical protein